MFQPAAERVVEAALEVSMHRGHVVVIGALDGWVIGTARLRAALVLILKADQRAQVRSDRDVAAVYELIAIGNQLRFISAAVEHGLAAGRIAIGAGDRYRIAQGAGPETIAGVRYRSSREAPERILFAFAREAVADIIMKAHRGLVADGRAHEDVLVFLRRIVGNVKELPRVG